MHAGLLSSGHQAKKSGDTSPASLGDTSVLGAVLPLHSNIVSAKYVCQHMLNDVMRYSHHDAAINADISLTRFSRVSHAGAVWCNVERLDTAMVM
jgi:hypothetical protein